jgi:small subunit ribosomal protein S29
MPQQRKAAPKTAVKGSKSFAMKKKTAPAKSGKPPMPGERKAMRKRIVLSNTNALQVDGLNDLSKDMELAVHTGKVVGIPGEVVDSLRAVEAFKVSQGWGMFRRPALLIREESVALTEAMKRAEEEKMDMSLVIDGERGTGKSLMLLHAMATAFVRGWIVLNISEGILSLLYLWAY